MPEFPSSANLANLTLIEELYRQYLASPGSVDPSWKHFFEGIDFASFLYQRGGQAPQASDVRVYDLILAYRRYGHLEARISPLTKELKKAEELDLAKLGFSEGDLEQIFPTFGLCGKKEAPLKELIAALQSVYCGSIGFECFDLSSRELEKWIQEKIEPGLTFSSSEETLKAICEAESFETYLQEKYPGQTRFSIEGGESLLPMLQAIIGKGEELGVEQVVLAAAHRARLNILANILQRPLNLILGEFEDDTILSIPSTNDIRYHLGYTGKLGKVTVEMPPNPSHLESIDPVMLGQVLALQETKWKGDKDKVVPLVLHGDASLAGLGVVYESLQMMHLPSYSVGGTIHIAVNNELGYTTFPEEGRSTRYCTDIARTFRLPIFHVNAEDPDSCLFVARLAMEMRQKFHIDVFIDFVCYRKYGHNEGDEPGFTQPLEYAEIRRKKTIRQIYQEKLSQDGKPFMDAYRAKMDEALQQKPKVAAPKKIESDTVATAIDSKTARSVLDTFCAVPEGFHLHPKLTKWLEARKTQEKIDWSTGECLAIGSLVQQGVPIRLAGEDTQRGTFNQRHMVWVDTETGRRYCPFSKYPTRCDVVNSPLTEYAGMGFELGYSWEAEKTLVLWEAQFGDFNNGAQTIIDQYLVAGEEKWLRFSSLVLLLPHGFEGSGPEHASARPERFLQLAASNNIQVVIPTTPAQCFHVLRRQGLRKVKRPLILFTPKSLLRLPACTSALSEVTQGTFEEVLDDPTPPKKAKRVLLCSGKVFYDLLAARKRDDVAILRIEQLYPLHLEKLKALLKKYEGASEWIWVQEDPENMGAWRYMRAHLPNFTYVGRAESAAPSTGSSRQHKREQQSLVEKALS